MQPRASLGVPAATAERRARSHATDCLAHDTVEPLDCSRSGEVEVDDESPPCGSGGLPLCAKLGCRCMRWACRDGGGITAAAVAAACCPRDPPQLCGCSPAAWWGGTACCPPATHPPPPPAVEAGCSPSHVCARPVLAKLPAKRNDLRISISGHSLHRTVRLPVLAADARCKFTQMHMLAPSATGRANPRSPGPAVSAITAGSTCHACCTSASIVLRGCSDHDCRAGCVVTSHVSRRTSPPLRSTSTQLGITFEWRANQFVRN